MLNFTWYPFSELTVAQLYAVLKLRADVFVVEQKCVYPDIDNKDPLAEHLLGTENDQLAAYIRLFPPSDVENYVNFGRVVTAPEVRTKGYGKELIAALLSRCEEKYPGITIECSAQLYLKKFYESFDFKAHGESYEEDGIMHIAMSRKSRARQQASQV